MELNHLAIHEIPIPAGREWTPSWTGWLIVRQKTGAGYWCPTGRPCVNLDTGDLVAVTSGSSGRRGYYLASRVGEVAIQVVPIDPALTNGVASLAEGRELEVLLADVGREPRHCPAESDIARRLATVLAAGERPGILIRCRVLELWAELTQADLPISSRAADPETPQVTARERFARLMSSTPESVMLQCSVAGLASQCGCSERHFTRLFREHFGKTLRARLMEFRLQKACQLLRETDEKVITVAQDCGYRHLGLFNLLFKRRFGMTPSEWRARRQSKPPARRGRRAVATLIAFCLGLPGVVAVETNAPAPAFAVHHYVVEGSKVLPPPTIERATQPYTGDAVTFETITKALGALQLELRNRGYATIAVELPRQQVTNGTVRVQLNEGRLSEIHVVGNRYFSSNNVMRAMSGLKTNLVLNSRVFQAELDRANANRDRQIYPELQPGPEKGTTALQLKVKDRLPMHGRIEVNNQNSPDTPELRINTSIQYDNLWQHEHVVGLQYGFSPGELKPVSQTFPLDDPLVAYCSGFYRFPLATAKPVGEEVAARPLAFGYNETTRQFVLPPTVGRPELTFFASRSSSDTGTQQSPVRLYTPATNSFTTIMGYDDSRSQTVNGQVGARLGLPLPEFAKLRSSLAFGADLKDYDLAAYSTNYFVTQSVIPGLNPGDPPEIRGGSVHHDSPVRTAALTYLPLSLSWAGQRPDGLGSTSFQLGGNFNVPVAPPFSNDPEFEEVAGSPQGGNAFFTLNGSVTRDQTLAGKWTALLRAGGQWANQPLINNEQIAVGGVATVRGYHEGEEYGDTGWYVSLEPRTPTFDIGMVDGRVPFLVRGSVFMDYGRAYLLDRPYRTSPPPLWSVGIAGSGTIGTVFDCRLAVACALSGTSYTEPYTIRVLFSCGLQF